LAAAHLEMRGFPVTEQEEGNWKSPEARNKYARDFAGVVIVSRLYDCFIKFPVLSSVREALYTL
jgi:hypothetical protein